MSVTDENGNVLLDFTRLQSDDETYSNPSTLPPRRILDVISRPDMTANLKLLLLDNVVKQFKEKPQELKIEDRHLLKFYSLDNTSDKKHFVGLLNMLPLEKKVGFMMDNNILMEENPSLDSASPIRPPAEKVALLFGDVATNKRPADGSSLTPR